ncbi:MAG: LysM peptidoglycan-binding domain-containing protein [Elusimicrobia bacterium]|nr:LysM peptidoglycan-binding domain-containing protein [Elusimicrobiota bacterium]
MIHMLPVLLQVLLACAPGAGAVGPLMHFEGRLLDVQGRPLSGTYLLDFRVYDKLAGNAVIWLESQYVSVKGGSFMAELGRTNPLPEKVLSAAHRVAVSAPPGLPWKPLLAIARLAQGSAAAQKAAKKLKTEGRKEGAPVPLQGEDKIRRLEEELGEFKRAAERSKKEAEESRGRLEALEKTVRGSGLEPGEGGVRIYEVLPGDTLRSIAIKLYGDADRWADLYDANHDRLQRGGDPMAGQRLVAPKAR